MCATNCQSLLILLFFPLSFNYVLPPIPPLPHTTRVPFVQTHTHRELRLKGIGSRFDEQRLTLRIHRGRGSNYNESAHNNNNSNGSTHSTTTSLGSASPERLSRFSTRKHEKVKISVSYPSNENIPSSVANNQSSNQLFAVHYTVNGKDTQASHLFRGNSSRRSSSNSTREFLSVSSDKLSSPRASKKMGKRNIKAQVKKFRMETKGELKLLLLDREFYYSIIFHCCRARHDKSVDANSLNVSHFVSFAARELSRHGIRVE